MTHDEANPEVEQFKRDYFATFAPRQMWAIIDLPNGKYGVYWHSAGSVGPLSEYNTKRQAAARLLQMLECGPVAPQTWPEDICVGTVKLREEP